MHYKHVEWFNKLLSGILFKLKILFLLREIDREEFKKVMSLMRSHNRQGAYQKRGLRTGLRVRGHVENGGLVHYFFGEDGNQRLQHDKFVQFLRDLHHEVCTCIYMQHSIRHKGIIELR